MREISTTPEIEDLIAQGVPIAIGISGGKDSGALALSLNDYLDEKNHPRENRVLVHAHLGLIEWPESLEWCHKLATFTNLPLLQVERKAGGMIERWESRWAANWGRYDRLECLKLILPWSTASMRFCTSELKTDVICRALRARWPQGTIISACGIRAEESPNRAKAPITKPQAKLARKGQVGYDWNPILRWLIGEVFEIHKEKGFPLHPAYTDFGASRVSCSMCILSTASDQLAALRQPDNHPAYLRLCLLELQSAFSFQTNRWLCDLDFELLKKLFPGDIPQESLPKQLRGINAKEALAQSKHICATREEIETTLPKSALFVAGRPWPPAKISREDAERIAEVRTQIFALYGENRTEDPEEIQASINARVEANVSKEADPIPEDDPGGQMHLCL